MSPLKYLYQTIEQHHPYATTVTPPILGSSLDGDYKINEMLRSVSHYAFMSAGALEILNVESVKIEKNEENIFLFKSLQKRKDVTHDVIRHTLGVRESTTSLDCLQVVKPFIGED